MCSGHFIFFEIQNLEGFNVPTTYQIYTTLHAHTHNTKRLAMTLELTLRRIVLLHHFLTLRKLQRHIINQP